MALQRPPILLGPLSVQVSPAPAPSVTGPLAPPSVITARAPAPLERSPGCLLINPLESTSLFVGTYPNFGSLVIRISCLRASPAPSSSSSSSKGFLFSFLPSEWEMGFLPGLSRKNKLTAMTIKKQSRYIFFIRGGVAANKYKIVPPQLQ